MKALEEHGKQLLKYNIEKEPLKPKKKKKKFLKNLPIEEWKKFKILVNKLLLIIKLIVVRAILLQKLL